MDLSHFIKSSRKHLGLSQEDLAIRSGTGLRFIRDLEQNRSRGFGIDKINQVLQVFGHELRPQPLDAPYPKAPGERS